MSSQMFMPVWSISHTGLLGLWYEVVNRMELPLTPIPSSSPVIGFGELLLRLSTRGPGQLRSARGLDLWVGGAEANVCRSLAALGHEVRMVSVVPSGPLGDLALSDLRSAGVDARDISSGDGRMGLYFLEEGASLRPSRIVYDREGSAFARAEPGRFDWPRLLEGGALLHVSGITAALGQRSSAAVVEAMTAARAAGLTVSFDMNYRPQLWQGWNSDPSRTLGEMVEMADILFANHRDMTLLLGREFEGRDEGRRREAAEAGFEAFPRLRRIASTARTVGHVGSHRLTARLDTREGSFTTGEVEIDGIVDRIGGGDAFAAGVLHGLLADRTGQETVESGLALACLKHSVMGDWAPFAEADIQAFASKEALDVRR